MKGFIEIIDEAECKALVNVAYISDVVGSKIFIDGDIDNYYKTQESYEEIKEKIRKAVEK